MSIFSKTLLTICLSVYSFMYTQAQNYNYKDKLKQNLESYLEGAVPEVDGKVVFSESIQTKHTTANIIQMIEKWAESKNETDNKFYENKIIYNDEQKHELVLLVNNRLIFTDQALNLDYAFITYYLVFEANNNECLVTLKNIKYKYPDFKNPVTADETISDEVALNKEKTRMYRTYDKFRVATVDMTDDIFDDIEKHLNKQEYDAIKNASKGRRANNVSVAKQTAAPVVVEEVVVASQQIKHTEPTKATIPMTPLTSATPISPLSTNSTVLAAQKTISNFARQKAWAASNYFIVGENIAFVRQVSALFVKEIDGMASIVCYINNDGTMLSQSQIMPSGKFKILYYTPNYGSYNQLVELSRKYANNEAYTDADISMIEVLLENSKDSFQINHLKIETVPTSTVSNQPTLDNMPAIGNFIKTDKCVVITGNIVD